MAIISLLAVVAGLVAAFRGVLVVGSGRSRLGNPRWERRAFWAAIVCVPMALVIIRNSFDGFGVSVLVIGVFLLLFSLAAIFAFRTRFRPMTEGLAAVAVGIFSLITGFTIGFFVAPFALALGVLALRHTSRPERAISPAR